MTHNPFQTKSSQNKMEIKMFTDAFSLFLFQENSKTREVEVDIDELLDMDNDDQRRRHLQVRLEI
jgi:hypothetical protein